ncbi:MAG: M1 aminopeptidase family protein [Planctomycetota bacterium]|jgi:hypothetical protein
MIGLAPVVLVLAGLDLDAQNLRVTLDPERHELRVWSQINVADATSPLRLELTSAAQIDRVLVDGEPTAHRATPRGSDHSVIEVDLPARRASVAVTYTAVLAEDVAAGERPGQIHNFSVDAHVGPDGVFLSEGSAWHPRIIGPDDEPVLHLVTTELIPLEGWRFVASGDPRDVHPVELEEPRWLWVSPRPVEGAAIAGNRHLVHGRVHETSHGPVEIVMHMSAEHEKLAPMFVDAAAEYLDLYVPLLGAYPYRRFTIVENFFSSGFALPGFTVLGPQVVGMAPRSLAPGYLDHELVHAWWGNGVYVDAVDGNWCEALTSYCTNYYRRIADDGEEAGRAYRRSTLMKLSTDPETLDDGPLSAFGSADPAAGGVNRFVGYDKGAFVFMMLADEVGGRDRAWSALRRFAKTHMGARATWRDLQVAFELEHAERPAGWLDDFFRTWVREHTVPATVPTHTEGLVEVDPDFRRYRVLPPEHLVPTIAGTLGRGGLRVFAEERAEAEAFVEQVELDDNGENVIVIGQAVRMIRTMISRTDDPITFDRDKGSFTVGGKTYDEPDQAVLHTMANPGFPGRFMTVFYANGEAGWSRLRLIRFYTRDTTVIWSGGRVLERRIHEPDRRLPPAPAGKR